MLDERRVARILGDFFRSKGFDSSKRLNLFNHAVDDVLERTLITDLAIHPIARKGIRTLAQIRHDQDIFQAAGNRIDQFISDLRTICVFPSINEPGWNEDFNPNPMAGVAIEIENAKSKYFLGSLLAPSVAGRWGLLIVPDSRFTDFWINTVRRMVAKGGKSPIPPNVIIIKWPALESYINQNG